MVRFKRTRIKRGKVELLLWILAFTFFVVYSASLIYPLLWGGLASLKTMREYDTEIFELPHKWKFINYVTAVNTIQDGEMSFMNMLWNSLWFSVGSAIIHMEFTSSYAYVLNKYDFKGKKFLYGLCLFMMAVPIGPTFVSNYRLIHNLGVTNSYLILLTATGVYGMNLILCYSYYSNISRSYAEAAMIDGANFYQTYFKAMRPQALPMMVTLILLEFIAKWNDYMTPLLFLSRMPTLATGLYRYQLIVSEPGSEASGDYPILFAGLYICMLPVFVLFAFFSDKLMQNINIGGLKG